ncbi:MULTISPECIES: hypothetical protein [Prauserella]|uniref:Uncharacterized protein n=1 Tax=Prauserella endophytica TaxID=1592324 RepID=A0ABY2RWM9_9PSEU|nr:hypothetical protein [Prauserella endophytica]PXY18658.1 hypothetical protein BAY59_33855 [Prauserella coralliicola]TKG63592.1 hypothetical protein FCN18_30310 [Prauserella endophytica]
MTASTESDPVLDILGDITKIFGSLFDQMDWAEEEIARAITTNPAEADTLYHGFSLLTPTHERMSREFVFRPHCREILNRVVNGADTRPGTAVEVCCACSEVSTIAPMRSAAAGLYARMWAAAFPDARVFGERQLHHEALEGSTIDDLEADARRRLAVKDRILGTIECAGRHHGEIVQCKYAGA